MNASLTTILLATDGSSDAALAGQVAADISRKTGAQLHVVHVWTDVPPPAYPALVFDDYSRQAKEEARELLRRQVWNAEVAGGSVAGQFVQRGIIAGFFERFALGRILLYGLLALFVSNYYG